MPEELGCSGVVLGSCLFQKLPALKGVPCGAAPPALLGPVLDVTSDRAVDDGFLIDWGVAVAPGGREPEGGIVRSRVSGSDSPPQAVPVTARTRNARAVVDHRTRTLIA